jgi:NO-binding membrane sensor protein with MHYT domain
MVELYFLFYRIPKMMSRLARERGRSAVKWSLLGMAAWVGAEFVVAFGIGIAYGLFSLMFGLSDEIPTGFRFIGYILSLLAAITAVTLVQKVLTAKSRPDEWPTPPPPPHFDQAA